MSVINRIEEQLDTLRKIRAAWSSNTGADSLVTTLEMAQARIERLQRQIDQRLPSEAEIALQLLPALIAINTERGEDEVVADAFSWALTFNRIKENH